MKPFPKGFRCSLYRRGNQNQLKEWKIISLPFTEGVGFITFGEETEGVGFITFGEETEGVGFSPSVKKPMVMASLMPTVKALAKLLTTWNRTRLFTESEGFLTKINQSSPFHPPLQVAASLFQPLPSKFLP